MYGFKSSGTYRDILREMAQLCGGFAFINRNGEIEFKRFNNSKTPVKIIPADRRHSLKMSDFLFKTGKIQYKTTQGYTVVKTITGNGATVYFENNSLIMDSNQSQSERYENDWLDYELEKSVKMQTIFRVLIFLVWWAKQYERQFYNKS